MLISLAHKYGLYTAIITITIITIILRPLVVTWPHGETWQLMLAVNIDNKNNIPRVSSDKMNTRTCLQTCADAVTATFYIISTKCHVKRRTIFERYNFGLARKVSQIVQNAMLVIIYLTICSTVELQWTRTGCFPVKNVFTFVCFSYEDWRPL